MENFISQILLSVWHYLRADWYILLIGVLLAVSISVYVDSEKLKNVLMKKSGVSIPGAVLFGALTPLCACGTMAVLLSMFVSAMPWGPVMAFLISSPLTSPSEYMFETAFFGSKFATAIVATSIVLGISSGVIAHILEKKTKFFEGQFRLTSNKNKNCCSMNEELKLNNYCTAEEESVEAMSCCTVNKKLVINNPSNQKIKKVEIRKEQCCSNQVIKANDLKFIKKYKLDEFAKEFINIGIKKILLYFIAFIALGRVVEMIIPQQWIMTLFSANKAYSVPLAATIGLPLYLNDSSALPLLKSFMNSGAGQGAVLAFIITGKATGIPVMAGMSTFMKKRAMLFYIGFIYFGGILAGYIYQLLF